MAKTQVVSVRLPVDAVAELDQRAKAEGKTRADVIELALLGTSRSGARQRGAEAPAVPVVAAREVMRSYIGCKDCGGINGLHQRGCSKTAR